MDQNRLQAYSSTTGSELTDRKGYEVDLSNGFDIEFDKKMNVIDVDK